MAVVELHKRGTAFILEMVYFLQIQIRGENINFCREVGKCKGPAARENIEKGVML